MKKLILSVLIALALVMPIKAQSYDSCEYWLQKHDEYMSLYYYWWTMAQWYGADWEYSWLHDIADQYLRMAGEAGNTADRLCNY